MTRPSLVLLLLVVLWALDAALGIGVFWAHDLRHHHIPWRVWAAGEWGALRVPLWSADVGTGFALGADGQVGVFYLPNMLLFGLFSPAVAVNASILGHVWLAGEGTRRLMERLGQQGLGTLLAAVAFAFSGFMASHAGYLGMQNAVAWLPWVCAAAVTGHVFGVGLFAALMVVAGHPQIAVVGLLGAAGVAIHTRQLPIFLAGVLAALLAAAPQLFATYELVASSMRAGGVSGDFASIGALPFPELINGVLPEFFGVDRPGDILQTYFHRGDGYWGGGANHWESAFYLGLPTVVLALIGARGRRFWVGLAAVSVLLMIGSPLWSLLRLAPVFDVMRFPVRFSVLLTLAVAVLAGFGLGHLRDRKLMGRVAGQLGLLAGLFPLALVAGRMVWLSKSEAIQSALTARFSGRVAGESGALLERTGGIAAEARVSQVMSGMESSLDPLATGNIWAVLLLIVMAVLLMLRAEDRLRPAVVGVALVALTYADLWHFGSDYNVRTHPKEVAQVPAAVARLGGGLRRGRVAVVDRRRHPDLDRELISSNMGLQYGLQDVLVPSPLMNTRNEALLERIGLDVGERGEHKWERVIENLPLVSMLGVRWLFSEHPTDSGLLKLHMSTPVMLYENPLAMSREFVVGCAIVSDDPFASLSDFQPGASAIVESDVGLPACSEPLLGARVEVTRDDPDHRIMEVTSGAPAMLVQIETHDPDWVATVDGEVAQVHRVNWNFRGVRVPAGRHIVELRYIPSWLSTALPLSSLAWLVLLFGFFSRPVPSGREEEE